MPINPSPIILVTGGAGFIGSHMVLALQQAGYQPLVLDNLSKGHREAVSDAEFIQGDVTDQAILEQIFSTHAIAAVMHFASLIEVAQSIGEPILYYQNNVVGSVALLNAMLKHKVRHFIFSSSAAVYGEPLTTPIDEAHRLAPLNPYGRSKQMVEDIVKDCAASDGLRYALLRYFNAAGADPEGRLSERHQPESHLIPLALEVAAGKRDHFLIHGRDYPTPDGCCIRDFVHVTDLCTAHLLALQALLQGKENIICNLGTGRGHSVQQVLDAVTRVTGKPVATKVGARRPGDSAILVADATLAGSVLHWKPFYTDLDVMVEHAWHALGAK